MLWDCPGRMVQRSQRLGQFERFSWRKMQNDVKKCGEMVDNSLTSRYTTIKSNPERR